MNKTTLETKVNYESIGEDNTARNPIEDICYSINSIAEISISIEEHFNQLQEKYPDYNDFEYVYQQIGHGYGTYSFWYDLVGIKYE